MFYLQKKRYFFSSASSFLLLVVFVSNISSFSTRKKKQVEQYLYRWKILKINSGFKLFKKNCFKPLTQ